MIFFSLFCLTLAIWAFLWQKIRFPHDRPRQIPTIPFWTSFFDYCRGYGRLAFYEHRLRPLMEKHGAVNVWIAGHWSILVTKPEYLAEMFRKESIIAKAGFRTKVPWGVFARYFGESVITSHGETWEVMHKIVQPSTNRPIDVQAIRTRAQQMIAIIGKRKNTLSKDKKSLIIDELVQQWTISVWGDQFLDMDFGKVGDGSSVLAQLSAIQSRMKKSFPSPIFSEFPILEKLSWLFKSRQRAFDNIDEFEELLLRVTQHLKSEDAQECNKTKLVYQLKDAYNLGKLSKYHYISNMKNLFAAGHEDAEQALISFIWTLAVNQDIQTRLRHEINTKLPIDYEIADLKALPLLTACAYEILRVYPPIFQLTNRLTLAPTTIGDIPVPAGVYMGWNAYGVHTNPQVWGSDAKAFRPERWGNDVKQIHELWRTAQVKGNFITFNAYKRRCLGTNFAVSQIMIGAVEMVRHFVWTKDPEYQFRTTTVSS